MALSGAPCVIHQPDSSALASKNNTDEQSEGLFGVQKQLEQTLRSGTLAFSYFEKSHPSLSFLELSG